MFPDSFRTGRQRSVSRTVTLEFSRQATVPVQFYLSVVCLTPIARSSGWAWEAHEGGPGKACLPSVVAALGAGGRVVVPTLTRDCEFVPKGSGFEFLILPEADSRESPTDGVAFESPMSPLRETGRTALAVGAALAACGTVAFAATAALWLLREPARVVAAPAAGEIPLTQMGRLLDVPAESYVDELRFGPDGWAVKLEKAPAAVGDEGGGQGGER